MSTSFVERIMFCCLSRYNLCLTMTFNIDISSHQKLATIYCSHRQNKTKWFDVWHNVFLYIVYLVFIYLNVTIPGRWVWSPTCSSLAGSPPSIQVPISLFKQPPFEPPPPFPKKQIYPCQVSAVQWVGNSFIFQRCFHIYRACGLFKKNGLFRLLFTLFYRTQVYLGSDLWVRDSLTPTHMWNFTSYTSLTCPPV